MNYTFLPELYPVSWQLSDLSNQVTEFLAMKKPKHASMETLYVFSFGTWDIWSLAAMPKDIGARAVESMVEHIFVEVERLYASSLDPNSIAWSSSSAGANDPAPSDAAATTTENAGPDAKPTPKGHEDEEKSKKKPPKPFRILIPELFDPTLTPGWFSDRPQAPLVHNSAEQLRHAVQLTDHWNSQIHHMAESWIEDPEGVLEQAEAGAKKKDAPTGNDNPPNLVDKRSRRRQRQRRARRAEDAEDGQPKVRSRDGDNEDGQPKARSPTEKEEDGQPKVRSRDEDDKDGQPKLRARDEDDKKDGQPKLRLRDEEDKDGQPKLRLRDKVDKDGQPKLRSRDDDDKKDGQPKLRPRDVDDKDGQPKRRTRDEDDKDGQPKLRSRDDEDKDGQPKLRSRDEDDKKDGQPKLRSRNEEDKDGQPKLRLRDEVEKDGQPKARSQKKIDYPERDAIVYDLPSYLMSMIVEGQMRSTGVEDSAGVGTMPLDRSFREVHAPCVSATTRALLDAAEAEAEAQAETEDGTDQDGIKLKSTSPKGGNGVGAGASKGSQPRGDDELGPPDTVTDASAAQGKKADGTAAAAKAKAAAREACSNPDEHLFLGPFTLSRRAAAEIARQTAAMVRGNQGVRAELGLANSPVSRLRKIFS